MPKNAYAKELSKFLKEHSPTPDNLYSVEHAEFVESVRVLSILNLAGFRHNQISGFFTDGTGDKYLKSCLDTLK